MRTINELTETICQDLIRGEFDANEAKEIIDYMLQKKIDFHKARDFGSQIRLGERNETSLQRIEELKEAKVRLNEVIEQARQEGKSLRIVSDISIDLV